MNYGTAFICNFDDRPGALCRDGCQHGYIKYVPMAAGVRCDACHTYERDDLKGSMRRFHDRHASCSEPRAADPGAGGRDGR